MVEKGKEASKEPKKDIRIKDATKFTYHYESGGDKVFLELEKKDLKKHKLTEEYAEAVYASKERQEGEMKLSKNIWFAKKNLERGRLLSTKIAASKINYFHLTWEDRQRVEDFDYRRAQKYLTSLEEKRRATYPGAHLAICPLLE